MCGVSRVLEKIGAITKIKDINIIRTILTQKGESLLNALEQLNEVLVDET